MDGKSRGFTLVEAMLCLAIGAVLLGIGVPVVTGVMARTHAASARSSLMATLTRAIGHAGRTGSEVVLCPAHAGACRNGWDWSGGWIAFADIDGNRKRGRHETLLSDVPALREPVRLVTSKGRRRLVIQPNGGNAGSNVTFTLCAAGDPGSAVMLVLSNRGQLRSAPATRGKARACADR